VSTLVRAFHNRTNSSVPFSFVELGAAESHQYRPLIDPT
jgi:hypothetical protein